MKRCLECEFTFADDQHVCDFDGTELTPVLERRPSSQNFSVLNAILPSLILRLVRSNISLAFLALAGIVLSALLVGYYSATEAESKGETGDSSAGLASAGQDSVASLVPEAQAFATIPVPSDRTAAPTSAQTFAQTGTPDTVTKRRATRAARHSSSLTSTVARRSAAFRSKTRFHSSTHKLEATRRRYAKPKPAERPAVDGSNKQLLAMNQKRPESPEQGTQQRSAAGVENTAVVANDQPGWNGKESFAGRVSANAPQKKKSKVIAMLKKTGRILTRPFKF